MKAILLNGALPGDSFVDATGFALQDALEAEDWTVTTWTLRDQKISPTAWAASSTGPKCRACAGSTILVAR